MIFTRGVLSIPACDVYVRLETTDAKCGGEFEQLARYTTRYQESDLHLAFILLNLLYNFSLHSKFLGSTNFFTSTLLTSSSIVAVLIAKAGHVWVS